MQVVVIPFEAGLAPVLSRGKFLSRRLLVLGEVGASAREAISLLGEVSAHPIRQVTGTGVDVSEAVLGLVQHHDITDVVVDWPHHLSQTLHKEICNCLLTLKLKGIRVHDLSSFCERVLGRLVLHDYAVNDLVAGSHYHFDRRWRATKRCVDVTLAAGLLALVVPLFAVVAAAIRATSKGPVFYRQERVGHGGRVFQIIKFRSMRVDAEQDGNPRFAARRDERVTPIGRFLRRTRVDELPQLFNVLAGDMSIVGPRPERPVFVERFKQTLSLYDMRHHVKPGITGWAQVKDAYAASEAETHRKLSRDLYYIKRGSLFMDLEIIARTIFVMMLCRGSR
jgi:exopolysaccharide biosynthesis polyprenyl glycosylphosphotransferase